MKAVGKPSNQKSPPVSKKWYEQKLARKLMLLFIPKKISSFPKKNKKQKAKHRMWIEPRKAVQLVSPVNTP